MNQVLALVWTDLRILHRTGYVWASVAIFAVLLFIALQVSRLDFAGFADIVTAIIVIDVVLAPVMLVALMILLERSEGSFAALAVTPLRRSSYLAARTLTVSVISSAEMTLLALIAYDGELNVALLLAGLLSLAAVTSLIAFFAVAPFQSLYPFLLPMIGWIFFLGVPAYGVLAGWDPVWTAWHPVAPSMALLKGAFAPLEATEFGFGVVGVIVWLGLTWVIGQRALRAMQASAASAG
jgi:fluoroquinolone transport system permease protein